MEATKRHEPSYRFGDPFKFDSKARQFDIFFYLFSKTELFEGIKTHYLYKRGQSSGRLTDDSRFASNIEQMRHKDHLIEERKLPALDFLLKLRDLKMEANSVKGAGSGEPTCEALYKHVKETPLYNPKGGLAFDAGLHGFLTLLSYSFSMEFLLTFASVGSKTDCMIRHLSNSDDEIYSDFSKMLISFLNEEPRNRHQLANFLQELIAFQSAIDPKSDHDKKSKQGTQLEKKTILGDYKNALLNSDSQGEILRELEGNNRLIDSCYEMLAKCLFLTENFQREQGTLWRDDPMTSELIWNFARKMCVDLNLYEKTPKDSMSRYLSTVNNEHNGTYLVFMKQVNYSKTSEKRQMMLRRYFFKNKYSLNTFETNLDFTNKTNDFVMYFMAQGGDSKVWQEGLKRQTFSASLIDEVTLDGRRIETVAGVSMTAVDLKAVFSTIQVALGMASDIVETFYNFLIYYDDEWKTIRICKLLKQSELKEISASGRKAVDVMRGEFNHIKKHGRNIHAVTCSRNLLKASDEVRIVLATSFNHEEANTAFILFVVPGYLCFRQFVVDHILKVYKPNLDEKIDLDYFLKDMVLSTTSKFKSTDAETLSYRVIEEKRLRKDGQSASVDEVKTAFLKHNQKKERPGDSDRNAPQYLEPDFIISVHSDVAKRLINLKEVENGESKSPNKKEDPNNSKKIHFTPSLTDFLHYSLTADLEASRLVADLHVRASQQLASPDTSGLTAERSLPRPLAQNWQYSLDFFLPYYYLINMEKLRGSVSISGGLEIKAVESTDSKVRDDLKNKFLSNKYRLAAFVTKYHDDQAKEYRYWVYEVSTISFQDLVKPQYHELFNAFVKATYGESRKAEQLREEFSNDSERTIQFLTVTKPLPEGQRKAGATCATSYELSDFKATNTIEWALFERHEAF